MKVRFLILVVIVLISGRFLQAQELKVMTFNIYHGEQNYNPGKSNLEEVAKVINRYKPDFVALQEVDSMTNRSAGLNEGTPFNQVAKLAEMTGMYGYFGKAIDFSNGGYGEGILSKEELSYKVHELHIPEGGEGRALIQVKYQKSNGETIIFAGTHLCHQFDKNRKAQSKAICQIYKHSDAAVILGGDFNFQPGTKPYKILAKCFDDAAKIKGNPENTIPFHAPEQRIDYIFISQNTNWIVKDVKVIRNNASDHMPVLVTLSLK
ncbi:endonuclease/exonuclease/phosphatase family protein [Marinilabilia rubra]|uniref:Endonuclease n=1 Tax=Marinilabilia rubra TaxID=2162893 RepID=A0A2U2B744_9BACT|nr:endonuclease/exonuclease/phosphatase family protein [Marinilabilia rubra]PWD98888.1 endonuclease [Marinilabilia rubra]